MSRERDRERRDPAVVAALREELGGAVSVDADVLDSARADRSGQVAAARPLAVVFARSIADVQAAMRIASHHRIAVVTRGAGTGLAGGSIAGGGELVLSTAAMDRILEISPDDELAVVEPGVINADLNRMVVPHGLWFAPDPASKEISTIGGNIATGAGGLLCAKYGVTREAVLGLKVVRADGTLLELGHRSVKGVTGLDLTALMIGSEGTLGVIVEATVKLIRLPTGTVATIGAWFADVRSAAAASAAITAARVRPAAMELIDARAVAFIAAHLGLDLPAGRAHLLVQTDGEGSEREAAEAVRIIASLGGDVELTTDPLEGERLLAIRRAFHPAMEEAAGATGRVLIEDVAVPRSALADMFAEISRIEALYGLTIPTVAHAGDGNLHPNFVFGGDVVPDVVWVAAGDLFEAALRLGGTLTGEHGIGTLKRHWLGAELGAGQLELQRQIKAVFDPLGILNPGKVF